MTPGEFKELESKLQKARSLEVRIGALQNNLENLREAISKKVPYLCVPFDGSTLSVLRSGERNHLVNLGNSLNTQDSSHIIAATLTFLQSQIITRIEQLQIEYDEL